MVTKTQQIIYQTLKKKYLDYNENIWKKILTVKNWEEYFNKNWLDINNKKQHGGYIPPKELKKLYDINSDLPKELPKLVSKKNLTIIKIPTCVNNSKNYQKKYIQTLRNYLLNSISENLELNFNDNFGGKTEIIASGLLPLFLLQKRKILTKIKYSNNKNGLGLQIIDNEIKNLPVKTDMSKPMANIPKKIIIRMNNKTYSAAEQIILALTTMHSVTDIEFIGSPTAGFTTLIDYIKLPNGGGLEYPIGLMIGVNGIKPRKDRKLYPVDLNNK